MGGSFRAKPRRHRTAAEDFAEIFRRNYGGAQGDAGMPEVMQLSHAGVACRARPLVSGLGCGDAVGMPTKRIEDRGALLRELMAVFDELPPPLREAINYAPEPLDPKDLATLCRRHGAANVLAMIELKLKLKRRGSAPATSAAKSS